MENETKKFYDIFTAAIFCEQTGKITDGVYVVCPCCENGITLYHSDWIAIVCPECKSELHKELPPKGYVDPRIVPYKGLTKMDLLALSMGIDRRLKTLKKNGKYGSAIHITIERQKNIVSDAIKHYYKYNYTTNNKTRIIQ